MPMDWGRFGQKGTQETQVMYTERAGQYHVGSQHISDEQHEALLKSAVQVDHIEGAKMPENGNQLITQTVKRKVHVPVEKEVKVPVVSKKVEMRMEKKIVEGTKMVPIKKYKDVTETVLETKEEVVHGFKERWVKVKEPSTEIVKKQVPVTRTRRVSYVDYVEQKVQKVVEVPKEVVSEVHGFRVDKHIGTKVVEVEEDVQYEMRPVYVRNGERRVRETGDVHHHGKMVHGQEVYNTQAVSGQEIMTEGAVKSSAYVQGSGGIVCTSGGHTSGGYTSGGYTSGGYTSGGYTSGGYTSGGCTSGGYTSGGCTSGGYTSGGYSSGGYTSGGCITGSSASGGSVEGGQRVEGQQVIDGDAVMRAAGMQMISGAGEQMQTSEMQKDGDGVMWRSVVQGEAEFSGDVVPSGEYVTSSTTTHENKTVTTTEC